MHSNTTNTGHSIQDFQLGDWVIRPQRLCLERGSQIKHIKPKSMAVLECLAQAQGAVVTRSELLDRVWPGAQVSDDVLTQSVVELRRAFGDSARSATYIETIPRRGFRLLPAVTELPVDTPIKVSPDEKAAEPLFIEQHKRPRLRYAAVWLAVLLLVAVLVLLVSPDNRRPILTVEDSPTLVVLPFVDMSAAGDQQYFADGLAEEVRDGLAQLDGLQVIGRTSAFSFRDKDLNLSEIAKALDVGHVLEGSVRLSSKRVRVTAQLVDALNGIVLWSEKYDRDLRDIFAVQDEIAASVATALSIKLRVGDTLSLARSTTSVEAHNEVLKGQASYRQYTQDSVLDAIVHFKRAAEIDPNYAKAWERLADIYCTSRYLITPAQMGGDWVELSGAALEKAVALAPDSPEVLNTMAFRQFHMGEWAEARRTRQRRLEFLNSTPLPMDLENLMLLILMGQPTKAVTVLEYARRLDPRSGNVSFYLSNSYLQAGQVDAALRESERGYQLNEYRSRLVQRGWIAALVAGDRVLLEKWLERAWEVYPDREGPGRLMFDLIDDSPRALAWLRANSRGSTLSDNWALIWAAYHGDDELALDLLNDIDRVSWEYWSPVLANTRRLEGFKKLVRKRGFLDYWRDFGWGEFCRPTGETDFECF